MQVTCFGFDWAEVRKRPSAQKVVEEMILTDDIDIHSRPLPGGIWQSDSAKQHFETAQNLANVIGTADANTRPKLQVISELISTGNSIDEIGLSSLTDGCYFVSLSPERVVLLLNAFESLDLDSLDGLHSESKEWLAQ